MEKVRSILKWVFYTAVLLLAFSFQTAYAERIVLFGAGPELVPLFVVCIAFLEGARPGAVMGIAAGLLCGAGSNLGALYTPLYFAAGYLTGRLAAVRIRTNILTVTLSALILGAVCVLFRALAAYLLQIQSDPAAWSAAYGGYAVFTAAGALLLYPLCRLIRRFSDPIRRSRRMRYRI